MMERSFDMFCYPTKKLYRTNVFVFIALACRNWPGNFAQEEEDMKITHLSMFKLKGRSQTTFMNWYDRREALVLYSPFFLMLAIIEYTVCNGNWSPTLIQGGGTPTLFGIHFVHWNNEAWNTAAEFFPPALHILLMCHSLLVNSNPRQFKGSWFEYSKKSCRRWLIKIENLFPSRIPCLCVV